MDRRRPLYRKGTDPKKIARDFGFNGLSAEDSQRLEERGAQIVREARERGPKPKRRDESDTD